MSVFFNFVVKFFARFIVALPYRIQLWMGDLLGVLWFDVLRIRRNLVLDNLKIAFPDWSEEKRIQVGRLSVQNLGRGFLEFLRIPFLKTKNYESDFTIFGREHYERAKAQGRGVCILTLHLGNGDWGIVGLALNGIPLNVISKEFKIQFLNDFWFRNREAVGTRFIKDRNSSLQILRCLKKGESVVFVQDQFMGPPIGIKTTFFGKETGTAMGLAVIAARSRSPVLPVYTLREPDGRTRIVFEPEIPFFEGNDQDETVARMTQVFCDYTEGLVRKFPEQWMWVHRRWKRYKY